jgi:hypothetical protein
MPIRPEQKAAYDAAMKSAAAARNDVAAGAAAHVQAADAFKDSRDAGELDLRHRALADAGRILRSAGKLEAAEAAYVRLSEAATAELGAASEPALLGHYYVGLVRSDRDNFEGSAAALQKAYDGFSKLPGNGKRLIGAALGLSLLRSRRWKETAAALLPLVDAKQQDESEAAILHNLALALIRGGDAKAGLVHAKSAVALRAKLNGINHPYYVDTLLVEALGHVEAGELDLAAPQTRMAASIVLSGIGEASPFFADALLVEARRVAKLGDGTAGEALARRAMFAVRAAKVSEELIDDRARDAAVIGPLWRTSPAAKGPKDVVLWKLELQHTLRRYQVASIDFQGSGDRPRLWYLFAPGAVSPNDTAAVKKLVQLAFADTNIFLNGREPADPNFLDVTAVKATEPTVGELLATQFTKVFQERIWEPSVVFSAVEGSRSLPLPPFNFALALNAWVTLQGGKADLKSWAALGVDQSQLDRAVAEPEAVLREQLWAS